MINSRKIEDLNPRVATLCMAFIAECDKAGIDVIITSTYRDNESQNALYAQGRTLAGKKVTNAKAGQSYGKADWNNVANFTKCGEIAESLGLEWAGRWESFKELAHCQFTGGLTLADLQKGKQIV